MLAPFESSLPTILGNRRPTAAVSLFDVNKIRADVHETDSAYIVEAEVPGVKRSDLSIDLEDGALNISGRQESVTSDNGDQSTNKRTWFRERMTGEFKRSFFFDEPVKADNVKAELKEGILKVYVPKEQPRTKSATRKIDIVEAEQGGEQ
jgi:HSP20 family protein